MVPLLCFGSRQAYGVGQTLLEDTTHIVDIDDYRLEIAPSFGAL
jgi:hypothetical protein